MNAPNYAAFVGFEIVTPETENEVKVHLIREDGDNDREATFTEWVLWSALTQAMDALIAAESILRYAPETSTNCLGTRPSTTTSAALAKARKVLDGVCE